MADGVKAWSTTAATNATADSTITWAEGQAPSTVNDSARAMMVGIKKWHSDFYGATTAGTSTAYTLTTNVGFDSLAEMSGNGFVVRFNATNGAAPTLNVDGLGAKAIQTASGTVVATGAILANSVHYVCYDNSIPAFLLVGAYATDTGVFGGNVTVGGTLGVTGVASFADGTNSLPSITNTGDTNTGIYFTAADEVGITCAGTQRGNFAATGFAVTGAITATTSITATTTVTATTALSGATVTGAMVATQANQETATATDLIVTPGRQHFHPAAAKAWAKFAGADATIAVSRNITSIVRDTVGDYTITIATDFSSADYIIVATAVDSSNTICTVTAQAAGTFSIKTTTGGGADKDPTAVMFVCYGDFA